MAVHRGLLYFAPTDELGVQLGPATIWATDGAACRPVVEDGFGNPDNVGVAALASYNGWLYAGLANIATGFEVWKLAGPTRAGGAPVQVMAYGGTDRRNEIAGTFCVFQDKLYVGSMMFFGVNVRTGNFMKGCELFRIDPQDHWEVTVGEDSLSGYRDGFSHRPNVYLWSMAEHDGWLYAGTWDMASVFPDLLANREALIHYLLTGEMPAKRAVEPMDVWSNAGADLYKSPDGIHWRPVFKTGLGDPGNYGVRTLLSAGGALYVGLANPWDGLEIFKSRANEK
jgi:hypothetical protein